MNRREVPQVANCLQNEQQVSHIDQIRQSVRSRTTLLRGILKGGKAGIKGAHQTHAQ